MLEKRAQFRERGENQEINRWRAPAEEALSRDDFFSFRPGRLLNPVSGVTYLTRGNVNSREGSWAACANRLWSRNLFLLPRGPRGPSPFPATASRILRCTMCTASLSSFSRVWPFPFLLHLAHTLRAPTCPGIRNYCSVPRTCIDRRASASRDAIERDP